VRVAGAINEVELCARYNSELSMMPGETSVHFIALPIKIGGTHGPVHG
jgi:hypothetical protein